MSHYLIVKVDEAFDDAVVTDVYLGAPDALRVLVERSRDWDNPLRIVGGWGEDSMDGTLKECICNTWRYEQGHMESCPLAAYPPEVIAIDLLEEA